MMPASFSIPFGTVPVTFSLDELWLLESKIAPEPLPNMAEMRFPPGSLELNQLIIEAIVTCVDSMLDEYTIPLTFGDCLAICSTVSRDVTDADGVAIGESVLLKTFRARKALLYGDSPVVDEPVQPVKAEVVRKLAAMEVQHAADEDHS